MTQPTLYARKEPTNDSVFLGYKTAKDRMQYDVVFYSDAEATQRRYRCPWHNPNIPTRRNKYQSINSVRWQLQWLPDLKEEETN